MPKRVNIGCGEYPLEGFVNLDVTLTPPKADWPVQSGYDFVLADALSFDYHDTELVYAGHVIEHLHVEQVRCLLRKIFAEVPFDASLVVTVPAIDRMEDRTFDELQEAIFGGSRWAGDVHRSAWRTADLFREMESAGWTGIQEWRDCPFLVAQVQWQACLSGWKRV